MTADLLLAAASRLRELANAATPGPWTVPVGPTDVVALGEYGSRYIICEHAGIDAAYIAAMSPPVALALADWLEVEAGYQWSTSRARSDASRTLAALIVPDHAKVES